MAKLVPVQLHAIWVSLMAFFFSWFFPLILLVPSANSIYFKIPSFNSTNTNIVAFQGDAVLSGNTVQFNIVNIPNRVGWVTSADSVRIWDSTTGKISDFNTHFSFIIDTRGESEPGYGLSFFLAPAGFAIPPNSAAGYLGLFNTTLDGSPEAQIVHVEFDSYPNKIDGWDPPFEHVGINDNNLTSATLTAWNASYHSGDTGDVWVTYNATTKNLSVSWTYKTTPNPAEISSLSLAIDLTKFLPEWVTVGLSAATGASTELHTLLSWEFNSSLVPHRDNSERTGMIVGVTTSACFVVAGAVTALLLISWRRKHRNRRKGVAETVTLTSINEDLERGAGPRKFSYQELVSATNNFSNERKLGKGGSGSVYRGYLNDINMAIAVKRISRGSKGKRDYVNELKTISQLRHRNLVQLLGWCHDAKVDFLIVYEFMPNGSLDTHLFGKKVPLTWPVRHRAALGLASALLYIHEEWEQCVVHRDVKSSNILLDSNFNVKLGDFGLARLIDHALERHTTGLAGTRGYMAPEYISSGRASKESDVYSFGVVALEIATGRSAVGSIQQKTEMSLVQWVWNLYGDGKLSSAVDETLNADFDKKQVECLMILGLWCAHPDHNLRPSIRQAIQVLKFEMPLPNLPTNMPVPIYRAPLPPTSVVDPVITYSSLEVGR